MIIQKIVINNFMCYYGYNEFEFTEGLNVIIGDNGYGKSKLYDAIYWVMYDQCFDTSLGDFKTTEQLKDKLISDKAIHEASANENITCRVVLTVYDDYSDNTYILSRSQTGTKYTDYVNYRSDSDYTVSERKGVLSAQLIDDIDKIDRVKKRILPDNIKPYMWFQGEQIDKIIDFKNSETLSHAINVLSDISKYSIINEVAESVNKTAVTIKERQERIHSGNKDKSTTLIDENKTIEAKINKIKSDINRAKEEYDNADTELESLLNKIDVANEIKDLNNKNEKLRDNYSNTSAQHDKLTSQLNNRIFTDKWIVKHTHSFIDNYSIKYKNYQQEHLRLKAELEANNKVKEKLQVRLPLNVPAPIYVNQMLEEEKCLVCNRKAPIGTDAYQAIQSLIDNDNIEIEGLKNTFQDDYDNLYTTALQHKISNDKIDNDINSILLSIDELNNKKRELGDEHKSIQNALDAKIADNSLSISNADNIVEKIRTLGYLKEKYNTLISDHNEKLASYNDNIKNNRQKLSDLVVGKIQDKVYERVEVAETLLNLAKSTATRVFRNLVKELEKEANSHYQSMMQRNKSARGIIKFEEHQGKISPALINSDGKLLSQINTGNMLLIKLSTIMAIISARKVTKGTQLYTLIADAPMSSFGQQYTMGFCKVISNVYRQSIIMSKDFYQNDDLSKELLNSEDIKLGSVYLIEPNLPESQRESRNQLEINITKLNK